MNQLYSLYRALLCLVFIGLAGVSRLNAQADASSSIRFLQNRGQVIDGDKQARPDILYTAKVGNVGLYMRRTGLSYLYVQIDHPNGPQLPSGRRFKRQPDTSAIVSTYRMDMELVGANPNAVVQSSEAGGPALNFYLSHCPQGITGVRSYGRVTYHDIYPNIDLVYYSTNGGMKYDFVVRPGGKASDIKMRYVGARELGLTDDGRVRARNPLGELVEGRPKVWSERAGSATQRPVSARYRMDDSLVTFDVGGYDRAAVLVIDPTLSWSTYVGGTSNEYNFVWGGGWGGGGNGMKSDRDTTLTAMTSTVSVDFPTTPGVFAQAKIGLAGDYDLALYRFSHRGARMWATYFGGRSQDWAGTLALGSTREVYVGGSTYSNNLPVTPGALYPTMVTTYDGFLAKFDANGGLTWCTYINGVQVNGLATDRAGNLIIGGDASSLSATTPGAFQSTPPPVNSWKGFLAKFNSAGGRIWATYFGGTPQFSGFQEDGVASVATDSSGAIFAVGTSTLVDFPTSANAFQAVPVGQNDAWVAKFDANGNPVWSTLYGGLVVDYGVDIAVDRRNDIAVLMSTQGTDMPITGDAYQAAMGGVADAVIVKFDSAGNRKWATYFGGSATEYLTSLDVDGRSNIWIGGYTVSTNFPVTPDAYQLGLRLASGDAAIAKFDSAGRLVYSSYFGGDSWDYADAITTSIFGVALNGTTYSNNFPTTAGAFQATFRGFSDAFMFLMCDPQPYVEAIGPAKVCPGDSVTLTAPPGFDTYLWSTGATSRSIRVAQSGNYNVAVTSGACAATSTDFPVTIFPAPVRRIQPAGPRLEICAGDSATLSIAGGIRSYRWSTGDTTARITLKQGGTYYVSFIDTNGCAGRTDTVTLVVNPRPTTTITADSSLSFCDGGSVRLSAGPGFAEYKWNSGETSPTIVVNKSGVYSVMVKSPEGCWGPFSTQVVVKVYPNPTVGLRALLPTTFCEGDSTILVPAPTTFAKYEWSTGARTQSITVKKEGTYTLIATDTNGCIATADMKVTVTPRPHPLITASGPLKFCEGDSVILTASSAVQHQWSNGSTSQSTVVKQSGRYFVSATNERGCVGGSDTVTIVVLSRPDVAINGPVRVCQDAVAAYSVPGAAGRTYEWSVLAGGSLSGAGDASTASVQWGSAGTGRLRLRVVNDSTGCSNDTTITVTIGSSLTPLVTANRSLKLCDGDSVTLDAGQYAKYTWSTGASTRTITVNTPGIYTVAVVDAKGCSGSSDPVVVTQAPSPVPTITMSNGGVMCEGDSVVLDAGAGYATYLWSNGYSTRRITSRASGVYTVTVTDTNGCTGTSAPAEVRVIALPQPGMSGPVQVCQNSTVEYSVPAIGGAAYTWSVTGGAIVGGQGTSTARVQWGGKGSGRVDVSVTTSEGCTGKSPGLDVEIGDHLLPTVTPSGPVALCPGGKVTLDAGSGYTTYHWSTGESTRTIEVSAGGSYTVTVSDAGGCSGTSVPVIVEDRPSPVPVITSQGPVEFCEGDSVVLVADAGYTSYTWSSGERIDRITVKQSGTYTVTVTNTDGCTGTSSATGVVVHALPAKPLVTLSGNVVSTASAASAYQWLLDDAPIAGGSQSSYAASVAGYYRVRISDGFGCTSTSDAVYYRPAANARLVWLDTVSARVGDRVQMVMRVSPALVESDSVHGYRADIQYKASSLFLHGVHSPDGGPTGDAATLTVSPGGVARVERSVRSGVLVGDELFRLDLEGLVSGQPLNEVAIVGMEMAEVSSVTAVAPGVVVLSGCEIGTAFGKRSRLDVVKPNPARESIVVRYRMPVGVVGQLRMLDGIGREVRSEPTVVGTGEYVEQRVSLVQVPSGVYMVELVDGGERSAVPIVVTR